MQKRRFDRTKKKRHPVNRNISGNSIKNEQKDVNMYIIETEKNNKYSHIYKNVWLNKNALE